MTINMYLALNSGYSLYIGSRTNYINGTKVTSAAISSGGGGSFDCGTVNITGLSPSTSYSISGNFNLAANIGGAGTKSWMNGKASFSTSAARYWNDVNVYNPNGVQDYVSGYFDLYTSENNSKRYDLLNEDSDMTHVAGSYFEVSNIRPYYDYYELDRVTGHDSEPSTGTYRKTFDAADEVLAIYMKYKTYYRDINAWKPGNSEQSGLIFDYYIYNRDGTLVNSYTNVTNETSGTVTREYGYTGKINNIRTNVTGAHYTTNNITNTGASEFTWTYNTTTAIELYSAWNTYTVAYNANGGSGTTASSSHTYNTAKNLTTNGFTRTGYTFLGWSTSSTATSATYTDGQSVSNLTSTNGGTVTLYAVWQINKYYFDLNGSLDGTSQNSISPMGTADISMNGSVVQSGATDYYVQHNHGTTWSVSNIKTNAGYTYTGNASYSGTLNGNGASVTLPYTTNSYTVAYNANGGSSTPSTQTAKYNTAITLASAISRANTDASVTITVTYDANGGSGAPGNSTGTAVNTTPYTFNKWALNSTSGTQYAAGASYTIPAANSTMYALWNTGTTTRKSNPSITLSSTEPTRSGYKFLGWATSSAATTATHKAGTAYTFSANTTLYAVWELAQATLQTKVNGAWVQGAAYVKVNGAWVSGKQVYVKVNGAWVLGGGASKITFKIDGTTYEADAGMTWSQWCSSSYNTIGATEWTSSDNRIEYTTSTTAYYVCYAEGYPNMPKGSEQIRDGYTYTTFKEPLAPDM